MLYGYNKLHSEREMPNVTTYERLEQTLPDSAQWINYICYRGMSEWRRKFTKELLDGQA
jgi:hypothetical protein